MSLLGLLLVVGASQSAAPAAPEVPKNAFLEAGKELYVALEYEKALEQLSRARTVPNVSVSDLVAIEEYTGLIKFELSDVEGARTAFRTALALDAHAEIPTDVSPKIQAEWHTVKREMIKTRHTADLQDRQAAEVSSPEATSPTPTAVPPAAPVSASPGVGVSPEPVGGLTGSAPAEPTPTTSVLLGGGAVALVAGAILGGVSVASYNAALGSAALGQSPTAQANASVTEGRIGLGLAVVGAAAAVAGGVRWFSDRPSSDGPVKAP